MSKQKLNNVTEFFTMDLNYESLNDYLSKVTNTINLQGRSIQDLQQNLKPKISKKEVTDSLQQISDLAQIPNPDLIRLLSSQFKKPSTQQDDYLNNTNNVANKMGLYGDALAIIYSKFVHQEDRLNDLEAKIQAKTDGNWVKEQIQNSKEKIDKHFNSELNIFKKKLDEMNQNCNKLISDLAIDVKDSEKKTLWNIQECNKISAQKANREYVDSACNVIEEKLKKQIRQSQSDALSDIHRDIQELQSISSKIQKSNDEFKQKNEKALESLKKNILVQVVSIDQFEFQNKENQEGNLKIQREIMKINAKGDPSEYFQRSMDVIGVLQEKVNKIDYDNIKFNSELELILKQVEQIGQQTDKVQGQQEQHQPGLCKIEATIELIQKQIETYSNLTTKTDKEIRDRFNILDLGVFQKLEQFKKNQDELRPVIVSNVLEYVNKFNTQLDDKISLFKNQVQGLDQKLKKNQNVQKDILNKINDIDLQKIYGMIDKKMDNQYGIDEFNLHQVLIDGLDNCIKQQNKEFEAMDKLYKQLRFLIENGGVEVIKNMVSHRITKIRCTMCNTQIEEKFVNKKEWPYDPNYKQYGDNDQGKVCDHYEKQEIIDLTKKQVQGIKDFNQDQGLNDKIILPGDTQVKYNKAYKKY